ncbi:MAG: hypothetical protein Tsb009_13290 [Planctomycetaceae bacterium]
MPILVTCSCGAQYRVKDEHAGRQTNCPQCGELMTVPDVTDSSQPDSETPIEHSDVSQIDTSKGTSRVMSTPSNSQTGGGTLLGLNRTVGTILLLIGLMMVLGARGCSTIAGRAKSRSNAKYELMQNEVKDKYAKKRIEVEEDLSQISEELSDLRDQQIRASTREERDRISQLITEKTKERDKERKNLSDLRKDENKELRELLAGKGRKQYQAARDAGFYKSTGSYWREWIFVIGTMILTVGLLTVGFTGYGSERTISLIMIAIITFSIYIGGIAWLDSIFDSVESTRRTVIREPRISVPLRGEKRF